MTTGPLAIPPVPEGGYRHARDIPDAVFLRAVEMASGLYGDRVLPATRWNVEQVLAGRLPLPRSDFEDIPGVPPKVVLAKFRRVHGRRLVSGCDCGCRGDFQLTPKGELMLMIAESVGGQ